MPKFSSAGVNIIGPAVGEFIELAEMVVGAKQYAEYVAATGETHKANLLARRTDEEIDIERHWLTEKEKPKSGVVLLDMFTASMVVQVWNAISEQSRQSSIIRFEGKPTLFYETCQKAAGKVMNRGT